ncbi:hypothetical protein CONPUDRAFT_66723, partial [Coniophora puteana RWD-64-598 SS2]
MSALINFLLGTVWLTLGTQIQTETPFKPFLERNYHDEEDQHDDVGQIIFRLDSAVEQLDTAISRLSVLRSTAVQARLDHSRLVSPLLRLPTEIMSEIFTRSLPAVGVSEWEYRYTVKPWTIRKRAQHAIKLGHVCRRWRDVALTTPWLW